MNHAFHRIVCLMLALVLVLSIAPAVSAAEIPAPMEKAAVPADAQAIDPGHLTIGGKAPTLNSSLSDFYTHVEVEPNNTLSQANVVQFGQSVLGATKSSDQVDIYRFTLTRESEIMISTICNAIVMRFCLYNANGEFLEVCSYYGTQDGWNIDAIEGIASAGTYYIVVDQGTFEGQPAYASQVDYVIDFHMHSFSPYETVAPTCTEEGYTVYACSCGAAYADNYRDPLGHASPAAGAATPSSQTTHSGPCSRCGVTIQESCTFVANASAGIATCRSCGNSQPILLYRVAGDDRIATSLKIASTLKEEMGVSKFSAVVVASSKNFPDALTGSYLAAVKNAPILLTNDNVHGNVVQFIANNLDPGGTVYILGGESAVSARFDQLLTAQGIFSKRLAGRDRLETNLLILDEAGVPSRSTILVCTSTGYADSLSASASGLPMLLVGKSLTPAQQNFLNRCAGNIVIIGGSNAVSAQLESQLRNYGSVTRLAGSTRYDTSCQVANYFFPSASEAVVAYGANYPDGLCGGPLAYALGAPLLLASNSDYSYASTYCWNKDVTGGYVLGGSGLVSDNVLENIFYNFPDNFPIPLK